MNYWDEVKRIRVSMRSASIYTSEATEIINGITGKYGYLFTVNHIYQAVPIEEIRRMISEIKKGGGAAAAQAAAMEEAYQDAGRFVVGEELTETEIAGSKTKLDSVIRQLELEVSEYIKQRLAESSKATS
ncbi:MAG: hypothetical protein LBU17_09380 [Treponema sp.]|jgi:hypothetical protein|nr:hypothetical protein [Treponema sp.]